MSRRIFRNLFDLVSGTLVSRILGFLRELVTASYFGTSKAMDLFVIAFTIPTFFRRFLGEDVVERAFMPPFKRLISQNKNQAAWRLISSCFNLMLLALIFFLALLYFLTPLLVQILAPGLEESLMPLAITMTYWILPFMIIIGMAAFVGGILNFFEMNKIYSLAPAMLSVGIIIGIVLFKPFMEQNGINGMYALPAGFLLGGVLEFAIQVPYLFKPKIRVATEAKYVVAIDVSEQEFKNVRRESSYIALRSLADKAVEIIDRRLASFFIAGSIASLWYAQRLIQLPEAIIGLSISRALVPYLTERKALAAEIDFVDGIKMGIRLNFFLNLPVMLVIILMSDSIINIVYRRGAFDAESVALTSLAFWCYTFGLLGLGLSTFFSQIFSIFQKNKIPFYTSIAAAALNILLKFVLVKTPLKHGGIALATSIAYTVYAGLLFHFLKREINHEIQFRYLWRQFFPVALACGAIGVPIFLLQHFVLEPFIQPLGISLFLKNIIYLIIVSTLSLGAFAGYIVWLGPADIKNWLRRKVKR
jgi:putative peptidoglycan lipid II flippase